MNILIMTLKDDLHAVAICHEINKRTDVDCKILEADRLSEDYQLVWHSDDPEKNSIAFPSGEIMFINDIDLIWWRRSRGDQILDKAYESEAMVDLINQDCRATSLGLLMAGFSGKWISHPTCTQDSSNKLVQLKAAKKCGLLIPKTLVSNDPKKVKEFVLSHDQVIVKPVSGTKHTLLFTQFVDYTKLDDESIKICPAIYQEYIQGTKHIRVNVFGNNSYAAEIVTSELDWRKNINTEYKPFTVSDDLHIKIRRTLDELRLAMGVIDIKLDENENPVWLEVNPQGQFLFIEGMTKEPIRKVFADYLIFEASTSFNNRLHGDRISAASQLQTGA